MTDGPPAGDGDADHRTEGDDATPSSPATGSDEDTAHQSAGGSDADSTTDAGGDTAATPGTSDSRRVPAREMTVNVGVVMALVMTPLVWAGLELVLTLASHHPGSWQLRLLTVAGVNIVFWAALGVDESRDDDWVGLATIGWLLVLLPLWLLTEAAVVAFEITSLSGLSQTYIRLGISGASAVFFGLIMDRLRGG